MKKTTVSELKNKMSQEQLMAQIESDKQERANLFLKELELLKRKYKCELICQKIEQGIGANISIQLKTIIVPS